MGEVLQQVLVMPLLLVVSWAPFALTDGTVSLNSSISVKKRNVWSSSNGTFALGFYPVSSNQYVLGIWYARLGSPANRTLVWMANRDEPVGENGYFVLGPDGNMQLVEGQSTVWMAETTGLYVESGEMQDSGNFVLYNSAKNIVWQSFASPTDTLLPGQQLTESLNLTSWNSSKDSSRGRYWLKVHQEPQVLNLALNYNAPYDSYNYSYWSGPEIHRQGSQTVALLDESGNFVMKYGRDLNNTMYIYENKNRMGKNDTLRRLFLNLDGNLRLLRWDPYSTRWIEEWVAVQNPCTIAGICGNGICNLDINGNPRCSCLPGFTTVNPYGPFFGCLPLKGSSNCKYHNAAAVKYRILTQLKYFGGSSIISSNSYIDSESTCFQHCSSNCSCLASLYGPYGDKPLCLMFKNLVFGGMHNPSYTFFLKINNDENQGSNGLLNGSSAEESRKSDHSRTKMIILGSVLGTAFLVCLLSLFCTHTLSTRKSRRNLDASMFVPGAPAKFSFVDLQMATNNFREMLGAGGFGTVFKGALSDGTLIAVKKLDRTLPHGEKEFKTEVSTIGAIHHMNLVRLCGFCSEGLHRLLVYEYLQNGSLDRWLFKHKSNESSVLDWDTRYNIALGTAQGIAYFHEQCRDKIIHCDIKPENILLDDNFCSKVSDFGLAKLMGREHSHVITMVRGTRGYLAPEWITNRPITVKADVYSYGMVLLEIIGGRRNLDMSHGPENFFFPGWAFQEMMKGNASKVVDKRLGRDFNEAQLWRALRVAFWCIQDDVGLRPYMGLVVKILEGSLEVNDPPMPQSVIEMMEEGLPNIYTSMKRALNSNCSTSIDRITSLTRQASDATFDFSSISIAR